jgi:hypothetical protein
MLSLIKVGCDRRVQRFSEPNPSIAVILRRVRMVSPVNPQQPSNFNLLVAVFGGDRDRPVLTANASYLNACKFAPLRAFFLWLFD